MAHFLRNSKIKRPMRPSSPDRGRLGREGRVAFEFFHFTLNTITNQADFAEVISRGIGNRENLPGSTSLFYEKAIVETEN